jgi:twinkle protein
LYFFDHFGSTAIENIVNRVKYMAKGLGCKYVFLDHLSIIVSSQDNGDERKAIDEIMTKLRMLVQETNIALVIVSHLKRPSDKGHEEGAATSLAQLRGSAAIAQLSDMVVSLERNGQADDPIERNTTKVRVLKNRYSGQTGPACSLLYNKDTGRMFEIDDAMEGMML